MFIKINTDGQREGRKDAEGGENCRNVHCKMRRFLPQP